MEIVKKFITLITAEYNLEPEILLKLWTDAYPEPQEKEDFEKYKLSDLQTMCKEKGLRQIGTKTTLINRLCDPSSEQIEFEEKKLKKLKLPALKALCRQREILDTGTKKELINRLLGRELPLILTILDNNKPRVHIRRNKYGRYEHLDTKFVFDEVTKKVVGKQLEVENDEDMVLPLSELDIEKCKEYKFEYDIPITIYEN